MNLKLSIRCRVLLLLILVQIYGISTDDSLLEKAIPCLQEKCHLPKCRCSGTPLPDLEFLGHEKKIPQFIMVTFDDAVNYINYKQYVDLFDGLVNPDHCAALGTFYVSHEYSDYVKINALYSQGHEIALHSVTHGTGTEYWKNADVELITREFGNQIDMLESYAKVNRKHIRGMRLPFLQLAGNASFLAAQRMGILYDSSWPTQQFKAPGLWPYTLDYLSVQDCQIRPCPDAQIPGFWVSPIVTWTDIKGYSCSMIDGCIYLPKDDINKLFSWMCYNFKRHYKGNRAPFGMYLHAGWFSLGKYYFNALRKFLLYVNTLTDVYITTTSRVIQYSRYPVLGKPFKGCLQSPKTNCLPKSCVLRKVSTGEMRYMSVCDRCPRVYPWLDNPFGIE